MTEVAGPSRSAKEPEIDIKHKDEAGSWGGREPSNREWSRGPVDSVRLEQLLLRVRDGGGREGRIETVRKKLVAGELVTDQALRGVARRLLDRL